MKTFALFAIIVAAMLLFAGCTTKPGTGPVFPNKPNGQVNTTAPVPIASGITKTFSSWNELSDFLHAANPNSGYNGGMMGGRLGIDNMMEKGVAVSAAAPASPSPISSGGSSTDYSQTNVQVAGVDEADMVKNDGKYIYVVGNDYGYYGVGPFSFNSNEGTVKIIDAFPAAGMKQVGKVSFEGSAQEIFVYNDKLVVFGSRYDQVAYPYPMMEARAMCLRCIVPPYYSQNFAFMKVYDISDRTAPKLEKEYEVKGNYISSRMINGKVYGVFSDPANYNDPLPLYAVDGVAQKIAPSDIAYFDYPDQGYNFNIFLSADLSDLSKPETRKVILMGYAQNLFVSQDNMYVTYTKYDYYYPEWGAFSDVYGAYLSSEAKQKMAEIDATNMTDWRKDRMKMADISDYAQEIAQSVGSEKLQTLQQQYSDKLSALYAKRARDAEKTQIHKLSLNGFVETAEGSVPGHVLNQFSMDESGSYFRIATTVPQVWDWNGQGSAPSYNNMYVLDSSLKQTGSVENIAPGEQIYSVRFMGNRAYMVTFRQIDPFFVLDLSDPAAPKIAGKLKLPGYSDYLHPYDETHIIGLGKDATVDKNGQTAWYQGVKLTMFDVSDIENPKEVASINIGDRGTDSNALHDHKAFLFSKEKNLLVIPVLEAKINPSNYAGDVPQWQYGEYVFQGAYVFEIKPDSITLRGKITHATEEEMMKSGEYYWSNANVQRSLYMDNYLYTVSDRYVKASDLGTLAAISSVKIGQDQPNNGYYGGVPTPMASGSAATSGVMVK
ncbi:MAG: beta-propeller domain-containing protein [Candidatus Micrarchaeota archaeon]|nr:beta-propeller domain-containing protein [Candidatus Micrarchaeota archaeon]